MYTKIESQIEALKTFGQLTAEQQAVLLKQLKKIKLFTAAHASAKMAKNLKFKKFETHILYMSPADLAFKQLGRVGTLCPFASAGCKAACLNTAGRGRFNSVAQARLRKALYYIVAREHFLAHLFAEIGALQSKVRKGKQLIVRINGTTDLQLDLLKFNGRNIFETYPAVQFYDYTKTLQYALRTKAIPNYNLTFSASESNLAHQKLALDAGINVAVVFSQKPSPTEFYLGRALINGDDHDLRFMDKQGGLIVALTAKGKAKQDESGFVILNNGTCARAA